ncbi:LysM peptidoglycan-binding domain-containing protein [Flammeovirga sp. SJP92]|uniref:LysM peptidoglycan-binding domain-containing protein n=1 Tax=Flammeovirga sp. SJP92 TaxID=1775430 RepID=UPI000787B3F5|nr:LysM peptidoglycan-binding domain-containing protein [Flammeovirga sp. SJP92]KXX70375.1 hypothetical protein AVL50_12275 [Flammeovirga sp. SJP92]
MLIHKSKESESGEKSSGDYTSAFNKRTLEEEKKLKFSDGQLQEITEALHELIHGKELFSNLHATELLSDPLNIKEDVIFDLLEVIEGNTIFRYYRQEIVKDRLNSFYFDPDLISQIKYAYQERYKITLWEDLVKNSGIGLNNLKIIRGFSYQKRSAPIVDPLEIAISAQQYFERYKKGSKKDFTPLFELEEFLLLQLKMHPKSVDAVDEAYSKKYSISLREKWRRLPSAFSSKLDDILPLYYLDELKYLDKVAVNLKELQISISDFEEGLEKANLLISDKIHDSEINYIFDDAMLKMLREVIIDEIEGCGLVRDQAGKYSFLGDLTSQASIYSLNEKEISIYFPLTYVIENTKLHFDPEIISKKIEIGEQNRENYIHSQPKGNIDYQHLAQIIYSQTVRGDWKEPSFIYFFYENFSWLLPKMNYRQDDKQDEMLKEKIKKEHSEQKEIRANLKKIEGHPPSINELKLQFKKLYQTDLLIFLEKYLEEHISYFNYVLADSSTNGREGIDEEKIANSIEEILWQYQYYLDSIADKNYKAVSKFTRDRKRDEVSEKIKKLLLKLENNPVSYKRMLYFYEGHDFTKDLQQYKIYEDLKDFIPLQFVHQWVTVRSIGKKSQNLNEIEKDLKNRPKNPDSTANGVILEYYDHTTQQHLYRYLVSDKDTIYGIAQRTDSSIDDIISANNWKKIDPNTGMILTKLNREMKLKAGDYIHLPTNYTPKKGTIFYKEEKLGNDLRYVAVQKEEGYWKTKPLQIHEDDNIKDKILKYIGLEGQIGNRKINGFSLSLELMVKGKLYAFIDISFKIGSELSIKTADTRSVNVSLSVMPAIGLSAGKKGANVEIGAGMKFSLDYFRILNGSYTSYSHFMAFLQLAFFQTFTGISKDVNMVENWDEETWNELAKGYVRKELLEYYGYAGGSFKLNQNNLQKMGVNVDEDKSKKFGAKYTLTSSSASSYKVKGLDKNLKKRSVDEQERALENWQPSEKKALRDDLSHSLTHETTIGGITIKHEVKDTKYSTNQNNIGETNAIEIVYPITEITAKSLFSYNTPNLIKILKNIVGAVRSFDILEGPKSILRNIDHNLFMDTAPTSEKMWKLKGSSSFSLIFKSQFLSEEDLLPNHQYTRMSIKGNLGFALEDPAERLKLSGNLSGDHEIAEVFGSGTISYISSVFNGINSEKGTEYGLDESQFSTQYNDLILEATLKAKKEYYKNSGRITDVHAKIPTLSDLLKSYQQDENLKEVRDKLLDQTMSEWKGFVEKDNESYNEMVMEFSNNIRDVVLPYVSDPNRMIWKWSDIAKDIHGLSAKQCRYYLGDMNAIGEYFYYKKRESSKELLEKNSSSFLQIILLKKNKGDLIKSFEKDILFPLFIENKVYSNISYNG